jgi:hypothetical protein
MWVKLQPLPYFIGLAFGLLALSLLGATVRNTSLAENFVRFHQRISPEAGYFPTAREVRTIVEREIRANPKLHVIVGGGSVFQGAGQHESLIWTRFLQEDLGPQFRVVNLAQRAGRINEIGNVAAELLLRDGRPVIYLADGVQTPPLQRSPYGYFILDAWNRNYLLPWPPRDRLLSNAKWHGLPMFRTAGWAALLDGYLNFNDFWNLVGYEYANSVWNPVLREMSFMPRRALPDTEPMPDEYARRRYSQDFDWMMRIVRAQTSWPPAPRWVGVLESTVPPQVRAITCAVTTLQSSYYLHRVASAERDAIVATANLYAQQLRELGFKRAVVAGRDFAEEDYVDLLHFSVSGGRKLASELAPVIRDIAAELGYLP